MSHERMAAKIGGYVAYYDQRLHAQKYPGMRSFLVATVTETRQRAEELRKDLHPLYTPFGCTRRISFRRVRRSHACSAVTKGRS